MEINSHDTSNVPSVTGPRDDSGQRPEALPPVPGRGRGGAPVRVGIVDDHPIVRTALSRFLEMQPNMRVVGEAADAAEALNMLRSTGMDVLILDLDLPGRSGLDAMAQLRHKAPDVAVLVYTGYPPEQYAVTLLRMGAGAFVHKSSELDELMQAVRALAQGRRYVPPVVAGLIARDLQRPAPLPHENLTDRELQVLLKIARGLHTERIADQLALSVKTVSTYRTRLFAKLRLGSDCDLTYYVLKNRLLD